MLDTSTTYHANHRCSLYNLVAWLGQQLDSLGFTSFHFEWLPAKCLTIMLATYQNENITVSARLGAQISTKSCSQSPNFDMAHCKVSEIFIVLIYLFIYPQAHKALQRGVEYTKIREKKNYTNVKTSARTYEDAIFKAHITHKMKYDAKYSVYKQGKKKLNNIKFTRHYLNNCVLMHKTSRGLKWKQYSKEDGSRRWSATVRTVEP